MVPTIMVLAAAATMAALGVWQIGRARERDAMHEAMFERARLPVAAYPYRNPTDESLRYRRLEATCDKVLGWSVRGGESANGDAGWRQIAECLSTSNNARFPVDAGVALQPGFKPSWQGGKVTGIAIRAPDERTGSDKLFGGKIERPLMIVAEDPAPGLLASKQPDPNDENNRSWFYAVQWFLFAATALVIYGLSLRKKWRASQD